MNINATLLGQMITFAIFVLFTLYVVWPVIDESLEKRRIAITEGLAAAERGRKILSDAEVECKKKIESAEVKCTKLLHNAKTESVRLVDAAKEAASVEREVILKQGQKKLEKDLLSAKFELQKQVGNLVILGAEKLLGRSISEKDHLSLLTDLGKEIK